MSNRTVFFSIFFGPGGCNMLYCYAIKTGGIGYHMIYDTILEAAHDTPIIRLHRMAGPDCAQVLVKYEGVNVGGSVKTRTALKMVEAAEEAGKLHPDSIIVEPTSGNQGIGLALVGAVKGYRTVIVMPDSVSVERRYLVGQYGAEVRLVHDAGNIGAAIKDCIAMAEQMAADDPRVFIPDQFRNENNVRAQSEGTAQEILRQVDVPLDGFCTGFGTGGTLTGVGHVLKKAFPNIRILVAEPEHAALLSGGTIGTHLQMGVGDGVRPPIMDFDLCQEVTIVTDAEAIQAARDLASKEGILCGISSGTNVTAALRLARKLGPGKTVLTILPDTGERYFSTPLFQH